jgi:hypothetical protein
MITKQLELLKIDPDMDSTFGTTSNQLYYRRSHEYHLINRLSELNSFLYSHKILYSLFGGLAVASYAGHLIRKLHDIDVILKPSQIEPVQTFLTEKGFKLCETHKSKRAKYLKYIHHDNNGVYQSKISLFPGKFTLLNLDSPDLPVLATYDFHDALFHSKPRVISSLDGEKKVEVIVLPIEDLIISKLWPTLEPTTVHDLLILLTSEEARTLNMDYISQKISTSTPLKELYYKSLAIFKQIYKQTAWYKLATNMNVVDQTICQLEIVEKRDG